AFAGNPYLIDLDELVEEGSLSTADLAPFAELPHDNVDYGALIPLKLAALTRAADAASRTPDPAFASFVAEHDATWLAAYAQFMAIKESVGGGSWSDWPAELRRREPAAMAATLSELQPAIDRHKLWQYWFFRQWSALRRY